MVLLQIFFRTPVVFQAVCSDHWTTWQIIKYRKPWGVWPFLSNTQAFTQHLWILKSLFKKKHRITPTQTTSKIAKYAEDTSLINSLVMKSSVVSWRWKCHFRASTSHPCNKMRFHRSCTLCSPHVIHDTNLTMNIPSEHWGADKRNIFSFKFKQTLHRVSQYSVLSPHGVLPWSVLVAGFQFSALITGRQTCPFSSMLGW